MHFPVLSFTFLPGWDRIGLVFVGLLASFHGGGFIAFNCLHNADFRPGMGLVYGTAFMDGTRMGQASLLSINRDTSFQISM